MPLSLTDLHTTLTNAKNGGTLNHKLVAKYIKSNAASSSVSEDDTVETTASVKWPNSIAFNITGTLKMLDGTLDTCEFTRCHICCAKKNHRYSRD